MFLLDFSLKNFVSKAFYNALRRVLVFRPVVDGLVRLLFYISMVWLRRSIILFFAWVGPHARDGEGAFRSAEESKFLFWFVGVAGRDLIGGIPKIRDRDHREIFRALFANSLKVEKLQGWLEVLSAWRIC